MHSDEKDPAVVLPSLLGHRLRAEDLYEAFGLKKSTYYDLWAKGALITPDRLICVARNLGLNPVELLVEFGQLDMREVADAVLKRVKVVEEAANELGKSLTTNGRRGILGHLLDLELTRQPGINPL